MSGVVKHIYNHDISDIITMWDNQIKSIQLALPGHYSHADIISTLKHYYPHEWSSVEYKYTYYQTKDKYLKKRLGKIRFCMKRPEILLLNVSSYKKIISLEYRKVYADNYSEEEKVNTEEALWAERKPKIEKINHKIEKALIKTQQVTPSFIDQMLGLYERKNTSQKDRVYVLLELKKYYSPKIIQFFFKLIDTELNKQLRKEAFYHLQGFNYQPRARRQNYMQPKLPLNYNMFYAKKAVISSFYDKKYLEKFQKHVIIITWRKTKKTKCEPRQLKALNMSTKITLIGIKKRSKCVTNVSILAK